MSVNTLILHRVGSETQHAYVCIHMSYSHFLKFLSRLPFCCIQLLHAVCVLSFCQPGDIAPVVIIKEKDHSYMKLHISFS